MKLVGNGGGYGYGIMGATHHNLEDIGAMRLLPGMKVYVPFCGADVEACVGQMLADPSPGYLRLNLAVELKSGTGAFAPWRKLKDGKKGIVIGTGPVVANLFEMNEDILSDLEIWLVSLFPLTSMPAELKLSLKAKKRAMTMEEHRGQCGLYETMAAEILAADCGPVKYEGIYALGYPSGKSGSQKWHQAESGLHGENLKNRLTEFLK